MGIVDSGNHTGAHSQRDFTKRDFRRGKGSTSFLIDGERYVLRQESEREKEAVSWGACPELNGSVDNTAISGFIITETRQNLYTCKSLNFSIPFDHLYRTSLFF